ncbi:unnamed protein product [Symbiodinium sp. CCMP2592]|nr:unnamed protein product [Symbiodinium sp. CCMP2592]
MGQDELREQAKTSARSSSFREEVMHQVLQLPDFLESSLWNISLYDMAVNLDQPHHYTSFEDYVAQRPLPPPRLWPWHAEGQATRPTGEGLASAAARLRSGLKIAMLQLHDGTALELWASAEAPKAAKELRPIAMGSAVSKLFSRLLLNRALPALMPHTYAQCSGKGRQTSDFLFTIVRLFDLAREWGNSLVVFKLDLEKAFDSLDRSKLLDRLEQKIGQGAEMNCWRGLLRGTSAWLQTPWGSSRVQMSKGIKQGGIESPVFFAHIAELVLAEAVDKYRWRHMVPLYPDLAPEEMMYMDDGLLWNSAITVVETRAQQLSVEFIKYGLRLNPLKCQLYVSPNTEGRHYIILDGVKVQASPSLQVMGITLRVGISVYELVAPAVTRARAKFWELKHLFRAKGYMKQRARVMQRVIGATALWFICVVPPDKAAMTALNSAQLQLMVWLLRFAKRGEETWEDFRKRAFRGARAALYASGLERWSTLWLRRYWGYAGHRVRTVLSAQPPISTDFEHFRTLPWWQYQQSLKSKGLKHKGRHYARLTALEQNLDAVAGSPWRQLAHDRAAWKAREDAWVTRMDVPWSSGRQLSIGDSQ